MLWGAGERADMLSSRLAQAQASFEPSMRAVDEQSAPDVLSAQEPAAGLATAAERSGEAGAAATGARQQRARASNPNACGEPEGGGPNDGGDAGGEAEKGWADVAQPQGGAPEEDFKRQSSEAELLDSRAESTVTYGEQIPWRHRGPPSGQRGEKWRGQS